MWYGSSRFLYARKFRYHLRCGIGQTGTSGDYPSGTLWLDGTLFCHSVGTLQGQPALLAGTGPGDLLRSSSISKIPTNDRGNVVRFKSISLCQKISISPTLRHRANGNVR